MTPEFTKCAVCCTPKLCASRGCVPPVFDDEEEKPEPFVRPRQPYDFVYRYVFYRPEEVERVAQQGLEALAELRIRDTWLKNRSRELGVPFTHSTFGSANKKDHGWSGNWDQVIDPEQFAQIPLEQLIADIAATRAARAAVRAAETAKKREAKNALIWHRPDKLTDRYRVIDGQLFERRYRLSPEGEQVFETSPHPVRSNTVRFEGERLSLPFVIAWLSHGYPVAVPKGRRPGSGRPKYRAQIRLGQQVKHLGMFDTEEERDSAVMAARVNHLLGLTP